MANRFDKYVTEEQAAEIRARNLSNQEQKRKPNRSDKNMSEEQAEAIRRYNLIKEERQGKPRKPNYFDKYSTEEEAAAIREYNLYGKYQTEKEAPAETEAVDERSTFEKIDQGALEGLLNIPGAKTGLELMSAVNRGVVNLADFLVPDQINTILEAAGSETRVPTLAEQPFIQQATQQRFLEPGLGRDMVSTAGEFVAPGAAVGTAIRGGAKMLPEIAKKGESAWQGILRQLGKGGIGSDVGFSAVSGAGAEVGEKVGGDVGEAVGAEGGEEVGELIGSVLAPVSAGVGVAATKGLTNLIKNVSGVSSLNKSLSAMSEEGASTLLAESMVREGLNPKEVIDKVASLGSDGLVADVGINFARLLRTASNKVPNIEGRASKVFAERQEGQGSRLLHAIDDATGTPSLTVDDEITRVNSVFGPKVSKLYKDAGEKSIHLSRELRTLFEGDNPIGNASKIAQKILSARRAIGEEITNIDLIDETKRVLDDQIEVSIRKGQKNKVRLWTRLKNKMVQEADKSIPEYKEARNMAAGKINLESAAAIGEQFLRVAPHDMKNITKSMGESEKHMFKLGAKQAVLNKIDDTQVSADAVKRLFGKRGDVKKLEYLFDDKESFNKFSEVLKKETDFVMTRRAAQANSTTVRQLADEETAEVVLRETARVLSNPVRASGFIDRVLGGLKTKKDSDVFMKSLEEAGDILLTTGMNPARLQKMLSKGANKQLEIELAKVSNKIKRIKTTPIIGMSGLALEGVSNGG